MHQDRFFIPNVSIDSEIWIEGKEAHHILHVKRAKQGNKITLFDGKGIEYKAVVVETQRARLKVFIESSLVVDREPNVSITIAVSIPKGKFSDILIQKCSELGIHTLTPLHCERSVVAIKETSAEKRERWNKIVIESSKQCKRNILTEITTGVAIEDFLKTLCDYDLSLIPCLRRHAMSLKAVLRERPSAKKIVCLIGPEGGFTDNEIERAVEKGCIPVTLGSSTLRIETAAIAVSSMLLYEYCL
ncbi:RsmE family RNA methyltransferase [uncultured Candidatus Kuenenia sp.]|jgi:16S rRNA (uracil1498-N3)-methyltransferase|uniref:RsmE family RNA methyltransferase n=1 Tax=uncultured Candidatus Kuenenia sp. TaxID=1048336 RepID=UPI0002EAA3B9|nr:RsmE family RNA methyltransferase [uncultured Candidatus Kuenenia sp.]TVM00294.1 MAG: 16S rRNA methyltransferase [Candidatus Kuenenia stuttgartiensis]GJQ48938.1 MAG: ribosomal RNA small subunit methyltransferase E [Candidatus Kuenenia stuttgartiensis]